MGPCTLQTTNLAINLRLNKGPCIVQTTKLAVNLRLNKGSSTLQTNKGPWRYREFADSSFRSDV